MTFGKIGARKMMKSWSARNYVQNGLVAIWDGIENAGWGVHDQNATVWKDLVGGGNDASLTQTGVSFDSLGVTIAANTSGFNFLTLKNNIVSPNSVEIVCDINGYKGIQSNASIVLYGISIGRGLWRRPYEIRFRNGDSEYGGITTDGLFSSTYNVYSEADVLKIGCYTNGTAFWSTNYNNVYRENGVVARVFVNSNPIPIKIACVRMYSKSLSPYEIAHNYAVDKLRFNLP